jgi:hypothetical protein
VPVLKTEDERMMKHVTGILIARPFHSLLTLAADVHTVFTSTTWHVVNGPPADPAAPTGMVQTSAETRIVRGDLGLIWHERSGEKKYHEHPPPPRPASCLCMAMPIRRRPRGPQVRRALRSLL